MTPLSSRELEARWREERARVETLEIEKRELVTFVKNVFWCNTGDTQRLYDKYVRGGG